MSDYALNAPSDRHNELIQSFVTETGDLRKKKTVHTLQSDSALVYWGRRDEPDSQFLVNILEIEDTDMFIHETINELNYVQPDFFLFKNNKYLKNSRFTRTAGVPDLIIEVWSDSNTRDERLFKQRLYFTGINTEVWFISQYSNSVECFVNKAKTADQNLTEVLKTQNGLEFDLRYLSL